MDRVLEPELMDDEAQSRAYAKADFRTSNQRFVDELVRQFAAHLRRVVDLGCGPGNIDGMLARAVPDAAITAVDGAASMIALARATVRDAGLDRRVTVVHGMLGALPLDAHAFDAVISKDMLHHLPDPMLFWREVQRLGRPGAVVYVMDLVRPDNEDAARRMVESVVAGEEPILQQDFYNSLRAAFTIDEVIDQLRAAGLKGCRVTRSGDRHMAVAGLLAPEQ